jgi:hypothetical protein
MSVPVSRPLPHASQPGRLWWLPAGGRDNGLDDDAWASIVEISPQIVPALLEVLRDAGVPAYAAPADSRLRCRTEHPESHRLWVGASAYGEAERALITAMPYLTREAARQGGTAWR